MQKKCKNFANKYCKNFLKKQILKYAKFLLNQWARSKLVCFNKDQLSMSIETITQALNLSMPNQWAQSHELSMSLGSSDLKCSSS